MRKRIIYHKSNISNSKPKISLNLKGLKIYILGGVCGLMAVTSIYMTIESSTNSAEFANLQNTEAQLLVRQQELQQTLVESLSINTLQEQSTELGFSKISNLVYVTNSEFVTNSEPVAKLP